MDDVWHVVAELALELHPERLESLARKLRSIESSDVNTELRTVFGPHVDSTLMERLQAAWKASPDTNHEELAAAIQGAKATATLAESRGSVELVWTGPSTGVVPVRHTERVLCDVIDSAHRRLFLVSYVAYEVMSVVKALRKAVGRHVRIDVLLEQAEEFGGRVSYDSVKKMKETVPSANVFAWTPGAREHDQVTPGSVHAKCVVADGEQAFVSSANLSSAAMQRNMELGVLIKHGTLPAYLLKHLDALITTETIEPV